MEIFVYLQNGLVLCLRYEESQQSFLKFLSLPLGTESERRILLRQGQGEERG